MNTALEQDLSIGGNIWKFVSYNENEAERIAAKYNLPINIAAILVSRGIDINEVDNFLYPKIQNLMPDPACLKDMEKGASRIADAIEKKEQIAVIGDYDVDGATSSSLLKLFFQSLDCNILLHIPEREEGYGPNRQMVDDFLTHDAKLLITADCGTTAFDALEYAQNQGLDVVVIDHHEAETILPKVYAVINPKRLDEDDNYPYLKYMAAVGVVFMTIVCVNRELRKRGYYNHRPEPKLLSWLDLVALGTVCDVVPLLGLNRAYVRQGLKIMSLRQNKGITALTDKASLSSAPTAYHLGYILGPRINAGGRVGEASTGSRLLCAADETTAALLAEKLDNFNAQRKEIEAYVLLRAIEILEGTPQSYPIAYVYGNDWHQGVIGIVAGKLKERYNLPAFVMSIEEDEVKGSARSVAGLNIGALIMAAKEKGILTKGGGHHMAAGFSLQKEKLEEFRKFAGEYAEKFLGKEKINPVIEIDGIISLKAISIELSDKLSLLEPFGSANPEPKFMIPSVKIIKPAVVGSGHVRCILTTLEGGSLKAMAFRSADTELGKALLNNRGTSLNVVGTIRKDSWMGKTQIQFIIEDAKEG